MAKKRNTVVKTTYRAEGEPLLTGEPIHFNSRKHLPLEESDFADNCQHIFWELRAAKLRERLLAAEHEAELCRKFGSKEMREKASKMSALAAQIEKLKAEVGAEVSAEDLALLLGGLS